jgi:hypothetical protein
MDFNKAEVAADKFIEVTGDKSVDGLWQLGDAIVEANDGNPLVSISTAATIRNKALHKSDHDDFWSARRLKQIGDTAGRWKAADRLPGVSLDAYLEAGKATDPWGTITAIASKNGGKVSIRDVRDAIGANGGTKKKGPVRLDKANDAEFIAAMNSRRDAIAKWFRVNLKKQGKDVAAWLQVFTDLSAIAGAVDAAESGVKPELAPAPAPSKPAVKAEPKKRERIRL